MTTTDETVLHATITPWVDDEGQAMVTIKWADQSLVTDPERVLSLCDMVTGHRAPGPFYSNEQALFEQAQDARWDS